MLNNFWGDFLEKLKQFSGPGSQMDCLLKKKVYALPTFANPTTDDQLLPKQNHYKANHDKRLIKRRSGMVPKTNNRTNDIT